MNKTQEALKMVIENLELQEFNTVNATLISYCKEALEQNDNLLTIAYMSGVAEGKSKALEQPAQDHIEDKLHMVKPTAYMGTSQDGQPNKFRLNEFCGATPLYTHPHQWQGLTDDEIGQIIVNSKSLLAIDFYRAIEQALKEKNHG